MPYEFNIDGIQNYFESLAIAHVDVEHNRNGIKSFARLQSDAQINDIKKTAGKNIVVIVDITGKRIGDEDDKKLRREMIIRFSVYAEKNMNADESKTMALQKAENIMFDFMTAMEKTHDDDLEAGVDCGIMHFLKPENFSWQEIPSQPWLINHYGWDLTVPFEVYMPEYNADKWLL